MERKNGILQKDRTVISALRIQKYVDLKSWEWKQEGVKGKQHLIVGGSECQNMWIIVTVDECGQPGQCWYYPWMDSRNRNQVELEYVGLGRDEWKSSGNGNICTVEISISIQWGLKPNLYQNVLMISKGELQTYKNYSNIETITKIRQKEADVIREDSSHRWFQISISISF